MSERDATAGTMQGSGATGSGVAIGARGTLEAVGSNTTEVEWQFDALDLRPVERWLAALPSRFYADVPTLTVLAKPTRRLVDRYMDTPDWRVGQAGFVLRTRQRGRAVEVTMKDTRPAEPGGLRRRLELTESLPSGLSALGPSGPVGRRVHAVAGRRPLTQVLEVRTRRQPFSLRAGGAEVAEVALDDTTIVVGPQQAPARLRRVEVEVAPGWLDTLASVVEDLRESAGLSPAALSKFEAGLLAAGLSVPGPPDVGTTDIPPNPTAGDVAFAVIRHQARELFAHEPGTRLGEDPEELHDMRVATRRLRAAMDFFASALPSRAAAVREELRWIAAELGTVRDLDVQLEDLAETSGWASEWTGAGHGAALVHLRSLLEAERDDARRKLLDALDSVRWERLTATLVALARQGPSRRLPGARVPAAIAVPELIDERHRAMRSAAKRARRSQAAHDFHRVRIRGKRLRYCLEFTSSLYGTPAVRFARKSTRLQDVLGRMQDAEVASSRLFALVTEPPPPGAFLPPDTIFVMGGIAERYRQEAAHLRESAPKKLGILTGRSWQELAATIGRAKRRAESLAGVPPARVGRIAPMPSTGAPGGVVPPDATGVGAADGDVPPRLPTDVQTDLSTDSARATSDATSFPPADPEYMPAPAVSSPDLAPTSTATGEPLAPGGAAGARDASPLSFAPAPSIEPIANGSAAAGPAATATS